MRGERRVVALLRGTVAAEALAAERRLGRRRPLLLLLLRLMLLLLRRLLRRRRLLLGRLVVGRERALLPLLLRRGLARTELGKLDEALADYREALRLEPANAQAAKAMLKLEGMNGGVFVDSEAAAESPSEAK